MKEPRHTRRSYELRLLLYLPWLALLGWLAAVSWFMTDDAFISFRYVRNLLEGHGLVFNPGEYVEGYSNFLWVLELAALWGLFGIKPELAAPWLSVAYTVGTLAVMLWWMFRLPFLQRRGLTAWMALGLVASSATFAVWTSGGGLETRQFTFFIVLAVVCLSLYRGNRWGLLTASLSLAAAAYTRPEGPLFAILGFGWFAFQRLADAGRLQADWRQLRRLDWAGLAWLVLPFVALVAAHYLFRYAYYGEWLPNTYYAKHVRPWYESGFRYIWAAALETGLYLLLPLAWVAMWRRWREYRDGTYGLALMLIGAHLAYVMRIGGDHFEYRPLDFYWPLLALPAAAGLVHIGAKLAAGLSRFTLPFARAWQPGKAGLSQACALALFVPVVFYANALQGALLFEGDRIRERIWQLHIEINAENAGWLLAAPGMPVLAAISNDLRRQAAVQGVAAPFAEHREFTKVLMQTWKPYENMERGVIPEDALMVGESVGIQFYYLPDLKVIDSFGLTDATVARTPVTKPNHQRIIGHDRQPPPGYLEERGVNFAIHRLAFTAAEAMSRGKYAVQAGPGLWMPFDSDDHLWVVAAFSGRDLRGGTSLLTAHSSEASGNRLYQYGDGFFVGDRFLGHFEAGGDAWSRRGDAVTNHRRHESYQGQQEIGGNIGPGFLTSYHPTRGDAAIGAAISPEFSAAADQYLAFLIAGGGDSGVGVRLLADGAEAMVWRGNWTESFDLVTHPMAEFAGSRLQLELFDNETGGWGHIMLDHALLLRPEATE